MRGQYGFWKQLLPVWEKARPILCFTFEIDNFKLTLNLRSDVFCSAITSRLAENWLTAKEEASGAPSV
jgi:hypothetical protein